MQNTQPPAQAYEDDEIDLRQLVSTLWAQKGLIAGVGVLGAALPENRDRTWFLPARVQGDAVVPLPPVSSADLVQPHQANAYLRLDPGAVAVPAGTEVEFTRIGADAWLC